MFFPRIILHFVLLRTECAQHEVSLSVEGHFSFWILNFVGLTHSSLATINPKNALAFFLLCSD